MAEPKIIFFDIDGTLLDQETGCISAKTRETLAKLHKKGILLCAATGRPTASLPDLADLPFDGFLTSNGSLCYTKGQTIFKNPIDPKDVRTVLANAAKLGRPVSVVVRDRMAANGIDQDLADYYQLAGLTLTVAEDFDAVCKEDVYQIMMGCRNDDHEPILRGTTSVKIAVSWERAVDVIPAAGGKGASIEKVLEFFHLDSSQALAFGDSYNDIEMLQAVGTGIAMGNATEKLKAVADEICPPVSEDGIYRYCTEHKLI